MWGAKDPLTQSRSAKCPQNTSGAFSIGRVFVFIRYLRPSIWGFLARAFLRATAAANDRLTQRVIPVIVTSWAAGINSLHDGSRSGVLVCLFFVRYFRPPIIGFLARAFLRTITALKDGSN